MPVIECCGSGMVIPEANFFLPGSRICIKEFKYFKPKICYLSSRKYDPGCSFRIPVPGSLNMIFSIPDPGVKNTGSRIPDPDPQHCYNIKKNVLNSL
jgi:hypothetical protein